MSDLDGNGSFRYFDEATRKNGVSRAIIMDLGYSCASDPEERARAIKTLKTLEEMARFERVKLEAI